VPAPRWIAPVALVAACAGVVALTLPRLLAGQTKVKETSDVYVLPPPEDVIRLSLGYRAALADYLWSHVLVAQGLRISDRRRFEHVAVFIETINALDPQFRDPYRMADTLITFQIGETPVEEVRRARKIMERGVEARPLDGELWLILGQFVGYIAPGSYLKDEAESQQWRQDGARMLARAAELGGGDANVSWQAIGGAGILTRAGERDAAIRFLQRTLSVTDDEELKAQLRRQLAALMGQQDAERLQQKDQRFRDLWHHDLPFVNKTMVLLLGPPVDAACVGGANVHDPRCALTWREWSARVDAEPRHP
jgi:hypothetical protein